MRWDFGFTCPFCLLHEADLFGGAGSDGLGGVTVEHRIPRSVDDSLAGDYANCLLACSFCNRARSDRPDREGERRLLDPTRDRWAAHFEVTGHRLRPKTEDAAHTHQIYDLDDERKIRRRRVRQLLIEDRLQLLTLKKELDQLMDLAERQRQQDLRAFGLTVRKLGRIRDRALRALSDLARYAVVPHDAPSSCRCESATKHSLPAGLASQALDLDLPEIG